MILYLPLGDTNGGSDLSTESSVVHEKQFNVLLVGDKKLFESTWQEVSSFLVLLASDLWHLLGTSESSSSSAINTSNNSVGALYSILMMRIILLSYLLG